MSVVRTVSSVTSHQCLREGMLSKIGINFYLKKKQIEEDII